MITKKYYKLIKVSYADEGYFCLTNVSNSVGSVKIDFRTGVSGQANLNYEYSTDGVTWNAYSDITYVQVDPKSNIYWRYAGSGSTVSGSYQFYFDFDCYASGNLMSLFSKTDFATYTGSWKAGHLFSEQTHLIRADFNFGSVTTIGERSLERMFYGCSSLIAIPDFSDITSLGDNALESMFYGCSSLTTGPDLTHVTSLDRNGLYSMLEGCSHLTTAYAPTITWDTSKTDYWLSGVAASGTLYADASIASTIPTNTTSGCPSGWTVATL